MGKNLLTTICLLFITGIGCIAQQPVGYLDHWPKPNGSVQTMVQNGNTVYVGGDFSEFSYKEQYGTAVNATTGIPLNFPNPNLTIYTSVPDGNGGWFIGGNFSSVEGQQRNNIARVNADGSLHPFSISCNGAVRALALSGNTLYIGGNFTSIGGSVRNKIAAIDITTGTISAWNPNISSSNASVTALAVNGNAVYAGGLFSVINGQARNNLASIDAATGSINSWNPDVNGNVSALAINGNAVYVAGSFNIAGSQSRNNLCSIDIATGNATAWNPDVNGSVSALTLNGNVLYAGGSFTIIGSQNRNNIAAISTISGIPTNWNPGANNTVTALCVTGSQLYAGGGFLSIGGQARKYVASLDTSTGNATNWIADADANIYSITANGNIIYVGGSFGTIGKKTRSRLAALDITTGELTDWKPAANALVRSLAVANNLVYAAGDFTVIDGQTRNHLAAFDQVSGAVNSWNPNANNLAYCVLPYGNDIYIGGDFTTIGGISRMRFAVVNSTTGAVGGLTINTNYGVVCMTIYSNTLYLGGGFTNVNGQSRGNLAAVDLTTSTLKSWNPDANNTINSMLVKDNKLYIGGFLSTLGGMFRGYGGAIDLASGTVLPWDPVANSTIYSLSNSGNIIYAGGAFTSFGGQTRNRLAAFNTTTGSVTSWNPTADLMVSSVMANGNTIYTGGSFTSVSGNANRKYLIPLVDSTNVNTTTPVITSLSPAATLCKGANVAVSFSAAGFNTGNVFTAQLSGSTGSFASPVNIGTLTSTGGGVINATIPSGQGSGSGYRIRIVASSPAITSADNGANLSVNAIPVASQALISPSGTQTICAGTTVAFSVPATTGFTYQWKQNGLNIAGATTNAYTAGTAGQYTAVVTNTSGCSRESATSKQIVVNPIPTASISPSTAQAVCNGQTVTFTANTSSGYSYQWMVDGTPVSGATGSSYVMATAGNVSVSVTQSGCSATSGSVAVTLNNCLAAPSITSLLPALNLCQNGPVDISFTTGGMMAGNVFTAQLSNSSGSFASPVTIGTLTANTTTGVINAIIPSTQPTGNGYRIRVISSSPATTGADNGTNLVVNAIPASSQATIGPAGTQTTCSNTGVLLNVPLNTGSTYQWRIGTALITGATANTYTANVAGTYSALVTNPYGCSRTSSNKIVNVNPAPPAVITPSASQNICNGQTVTLSANTGTGITYQWLQDGNLVSGATATTYTAGIAGSYSVITSKNGCFATSGNVVLTAICGAVITSAGTVTRCSGDTISIAFTASAQAGNIYTLELSDATGSFTNPAFIGSIAGIGSGVITGTIPTGLTPGNGYKLRVNSSAPIITGNTSALTLSLLDAIAPVSLCAVTVDPTIGKNTLVWDKPMVNNIDSFIFYKSGIAAGQMIRFGSQPYSAFSTVTDPISDPSVMAMQYSISAKNTCGETVLSAPHKTMHLTINKGQNNNTWNLIWNGYQGVAHATYNIWRGASAATMSVIMQLPAGSYNSYTDNAAPAGTVFYMVTIADGPACNPTARTTGGGEWISSNIASNTKAIAVSWTDISVFPNPSSSSAELLIQSSDLRTFRINIHDITGKVAEQTEAESNKAVSFGKMLSPGIYLIEATDKEGRRLIKKWIKE